MSPDDKKAQKILKSVRTLLAKNGYMGTTITLVAKEAGVSRGLLHYYFKHKEEMLATVIKENIEISITMVKAVFEQNTSPEGYAKGITALLRGVMEDDPNFFHLFFEGVAVAKHSNIVSAEIETLYGRVRKALEACLGQAEKDGSIAPELPVSALAAILTGLIDGMGLQLLIDPKLCGDDMIWNSIETALIDLLTKQQ